MAYLIFAATCFVLGGARKVVRVEGRGYFYRCLLFCFLA